MSLSSQIIPLEERITHYLNLPREAEIVDIQPTDIYNGTNRLYEGHKALFSYKKYRNTFIEWYSKKVIHLWPFKKIRSLPNYENYRNLLTLSDFLKNFSKFPKDIQNGKFLLYHGEKEIDDNLPYIRKARKVDDKQSVLYKLSTIRHLHPCKTVQKTDIEWKNKKDSVTWRGATTSAKYRNRFVEQYFDSYNIGFSSTKQFPELSHLTREILSIKDQLKYKFIISLEGYDLASNLKWILSSNSVPIMPKPTWVSWIMEDKLVPYEHYLPLNDKLDNLEEIISWALKNEEQCQKIALNGKRYMDQFFDEKTELALQQTLLSEYLKLICIKEN